MDYNNNRLTSTQKNSNQLRWSHGKFNWREGAELDPSLSNDDDWNVTRTQTVNTLQ